MRLATDAAAGEAVVSVVNEPPPRRTAGGYARRRRPRPRQPGRTGPPGRRPAARAAGRRRVRRHRPTAAHRRRRGHAAGRPTGARPGPSRRPAQHARRDLGADRRRGRAPGPELRLHVLHHVPVGTRRRRVRRAAHRRAAVHRGTTPAGQPGGDDRIRAAVPADPPGADECRLYRTTTLEFSPVYRLCFTDGRLSHKDSDRVRIAVMTRHRIRHHVTTDSPLEVTMSVLDTFAPRRPGRRRHRRQPRTG